MKHKLNKNAFTIIEILVVVVVIGIISLIAIGGVAAARQRASNARTIVNASVYYDAFIAHAVDKGEYPSISGQVCMGLGYEDITSDGVGDCYWPEAVNWIVSEDTVVMDELRPYLGRTEVVNDKLVSWGNVSSRGAFINKQVSLVLDGDSDVDFTLRYVLEGHEESCGLPAIRSLGSQNFSTANENEYTWTSSSSDSTFCYIAFPKENSF